MTKRDFISEVALGVLSRHGAIKVNMLDKMYFLTCEDGANAKSFNFTSALIKLLVQDKK